ncbi:putative vacuolar atp synthase subunit G (vma-10) [Mycena maculata]|uniref:V-type proton ATPase subunit G n=1 Tax=Mycena maculata TaxID=230809 RepID=A0AAD7H9Z3_9AGAR|nr:putative vacuolar atp synthase subunit G (vma-10) [Mycena maculata]
MLVADIALIILCSRAGNRQGPKAEGCPLRGVERNRRYKKAKEQEFTAFESSHAGTTSSAQTAVDKETEVNLKNITDSFNKNKGQVVKKLLDRVVLVKPELHRNLTKVQA